MTRTVLDSALLHELIGGHDPKDSTSVTTPVTGLVEAARLGATGDLAGVRVGIVKELQGDAWSAPVVERFNESIEVLKGAAAGVGNVAKTGAQAAGQKVAAGARAFGERTASVFRGESSAGADTSASEGGASGATSDAKQPAWAKRLHRRQQISHAATTATHTLRGGDGGGSAQGPSLGDSDS